MYSLVQATVIPWDHIMQPHLGLIMNDTPVPFGFSGSVCVITFTPLYRLPPAYSSLRCSPCGPSLPPSLPPCCWQALLRGRTGPSGLGEGSSPPRGRWVHLPKVTAVRLLRGPSNGPFKQNPTNTSVAIPMLYVGSRLANQALVLVVFTSVVYYPRYIKGADP